MVGLPALLFVWGMAVSLSRRGERPTEPTYQRVTWISIARHGLVAFSAACFCAWLPSTLGVNTSIAILMIFPMALAGLYCGAMVGFAIAGLSCITYLLVASLLGIVHSRTIDLQLIFALSSDLALLSGAARDDRWHQWRRANYDLLTGLPNRQLLADRFEQARRRAQRNGKPMAILYLDLDHFKEINDTFGHDAGDLLLVQAADRITHCLRTCDTVSRLGDYEFVVVLSDVENPSGVDRVAVNILASLARRFSLAEGVGHVSGSLGIAVFPDDGNDLQMLQCLADKALYEAKRAGRNCHKRHAPSERRARSEGQAA